MSVRRQLQQDATPRPDGSNSSGDKRRRRVPPLKSVIVEVMNMRKAQSCMAPALEPLLRRVVKEEVELALRKYMTSIKRNSTKGVYPCQFRNLKLKFIDAISPPIFTGTRIEGEESSLKVVLVDALTEQVVSTGPESYAKVEIVVLEGDFDGEEGGNWTVEEFKNNIVRERGGKKPLLSGDAFLNLKEGIGLVGDISFTDNSSWTRSRRFRLGARLVDTFEGIRIREAKTESFIVRDHRGELYKKHHPPSLSDEVWRLEKIGKDGAFHRRLSKERVNKVKDFLTLLYLDPVRLRNVLGTGMSTKMWEVTVEHALTCVLDKRSYLYCPSRSLQSNGVVFNIVGQVMGLFSDCQYLPIDKLSETQKDDARDLVIGAFRHWEGVVSFEDELSLMDYTLQFSTVQLSSSLPMMANSDSSGDLLTSQKVSICDYQQLIASTPDNLPSISSIAGLNSLDDYILHNIDNMDVSFDQPLSFPSQDSNSFMDDTDSFTPPFCADMHFPFFATDSSLPGPTSPDLHSIVNSFLAHNAIVPLDKAQRRWKMLFSVFRWFSVRRIIKRKTVVSQNKKCVLY
ncbi:calmodulin-binding protein 60 A-like [Nicotiana tomentosiformis]|uniref:calmodulin-binding protein 60 A-like n=1 Tax=Nicotiana tomentosiformis TaxID=4098 RepID=UPI00051B858F|nr:calmodulin-binding protein 60 A-like [Nicotiana tomentosiformis]XP_033511184.1 calmodulin-binding protein 60 A-like [Nicotiana tomentosiformis]